MTLHTPEGGEKYWRVELAPHPQTIHIATNCGPDSNLVMVNFYEKTRWLTWAETKELATALSEAADAMAPAGVSDA